MSVDELQAAITRLSAEEIDRFSRWLDEYRADLWDQRIEADHPGRSPGIGRPASRQGFRGGPPHPAALNHFAAPEFWFHHRQLPDDIRAFADRCFLVLRTDPSHPSPRLKKIGAFCPVSVGLHYRALAHDRPEGLVWFRVGPHHR